MRERLFRFKHFSVDHSRSAMKVGVDSVLLGAWAPLTYASRILDVGSGCGLLALMAAQRNDSARIDAVEVEPEAATESATNFAASPWSSRLYLFRSDFHDFAMAPGNAGLYDFIVSNPPYFDSGVSAGVNSRMLARHQGSLSPSVLLSDARSLLMPDSHVAMVVPWHIGRSLLENPVPDYLLETCCEVRGRAELPPKRMLVLWRFLGNNNNHNLECTDLKNQVQPESLILEEAPGVPTEQHRRLCADFYLKF